MQVKALLLALAIANLGESACVQWTSGIVSTFSLNHKWLPHTFADRLVGYTPWQETNWQQL